MKKTTQLVTSLIFFLLCYVSVQAATNYWDIDGVTAGAGGPTPAGTWDTGTTPNWTTDATGASAGINWTANDDAVFSAGADAIGTFAVTVDTTQTAGNLTVEEGDITFSGGTSLDVGGGAVGKGIIHVATGATNTISTVLTGGDNNNQITKTGAGRLVLTADNFGGGSTMATTVVAEGVLVAGNAGALGNTSLPTIVSNGASLNITVGNSDNLILYGQGVSGAGGALRCIAGTTRGGATILGSDARVNNDAGGTWTWNNGTAIDGTNAGGVYSVTFGGNGGTFRLNNGFRTIILNNAPIYKDGASVLRFETPCIGVSETYHNGGFIITRTSGTGQWMAAGKTCYVAAAASGFLTAGFSPNLTMPIELASGANTLFNVVSNTTFTENSVINGPGGLSVTNLGKLILKTANTYSGNTTILGSPTPKPNGGGGTLALDGSGSIASSPVIDVQQNAIFDVSLVTGGYVLGAAQTLKGNGSVLGDVTANGTISPGASVGTLSFTGNLTIAGNLAIEVDKSLSPSNDVITVTGLITNTTGAITVANLGPALTIGDTFQIFNQGVTNGGSMAVTGGGANWANNLAADGSISVSSLQPVAPATNLTIQAASPTSFNLGGMGVASSTYYVYASTNVTTPMTNWWLIGTTNSSGGGVIQFLDAQATNSQRFYRFGQPSP